LAWDTDMKLTETEEKFARFALDGAATENERKVAAEHLLKSLRDRGIKTEDIEREEVRVEIVRVPEPATAPRPVKRTSVRVWSPWLPGVKATTFHPTKK